MSDERDGEQPETTPPDVDPDGVEPDPEPIEIAEMSPPPPPPDDAPIDPPPDAPTDDPPPPPDTAVAPPVVPVGPGSDPAALDTPPPDGKQPWPSSAKAAVAILVVLALLGLAGTIIGFARASSAEDDTDELAAELADANDRIVALEDQLASLGDETGSMSDRVEQLMSERDEALRERDQAVAEREEAQAVAEAERALLETEIETLEAEIETLEAEIDAVLGDLEELFPLSLRFDLGQLDIDGDYDVSFTEIGCAGLDLCGTPPSTNTATITSAGGLRLVAPNLFEIPLVVVDGTPFGVADSEGLVGPCGETPRVTSLTMALFDDVVEIDEDGDIAVTGLGATIVIDAPAVDECEIGRVWYRAELTPRG
jgi:hypothetical protein